MLHKTVSEEKNNGIYVSCVVFHHFLLYVAQTCSTSSVETKADILKNASDASYNARQWAPVS